MSLGERLRMFREEKGLSQTQVARELNISRQAYNNYECGIRHPDIPSLSNIASCFGVTVDCLLGLSRGNKILSANLKNLREKRGCSQEQMAKTLEIAPGAYARYEAGEQEPVFEVLEKLSKFFKVGVGYLLMGQPDELSNIFRGRMSYVLELADQINRREIVTDLDLWCKIIDGEVPVTPKLVKDVAAASGVPVEYLIGLTDDDSLIGTKKPAINSDDGREALFNELLSSLPPARLDEALRYLRYIASTTEEDKP